MSRRVLYNCKFVTFVVIGVDGRPPMERDSMT